MVKVPEKWDAVASEWGMACPNCGSGESLDITAEVNVRLRVDGTDADTARDGDHIWDSVSSCTCGCGWLGTVAATERFYATGATLASNTEDS